MFNIIDKYIYIYIIKCLAQIQYFIKTCQIICDHNLLYTLKIYCYYIL
ncbi:hypothetical protein pb186bvf_020551 [Paramecium bursaria]